MWTREDFPLGSLGCRLGTAHPSDQAVSSSIWCHPRWFLLLSLHEATVKKTTLELFRQRVTNIEKTNGRADDVWPEFFTEPARKVAAKHLAAAYNAQKELGSFCWAVWEADVLESKGCYVQHVPQLLVCCGCDHNQIVLNSLGHVRAFLYTVARKSHGTSEIWRCVRCFIHGLSPRDI